MPDPKSESEKKPFRVGDVCEYVGSDGHWSKRHIIEECKVRGPEFFEYCTSQGAWIPHECLKLTEESSVESRAELWRLMVEECEELSE